MLLSFLLLFLTLNQEIGLLGEFSTLDENEYVTMIMIKICSCKVEDKK